MKKILTTFVTRKRFFVAIYVIFISIIAVAQKPYIEVCGVKWAKGNLQYDAIGGGNDSFQRDWKLSPNQWYFFHYGDNVPSYNVSSTDKRVDLFTWGVCGNWNFLNNSSIYATTQNTDIASKLFIDAECMTETSAFAEAKYGDIAYWASNGQYRLPTLEEISMLVNEASFQYGYYLADNNIKIYGYLFTSPQPTRITNNIERRLTDNDLEDGLFLPMGGEGVSGQSTIESINDKVSYWSSTVERYPQAIHLNHVNNGPTLGAYSVYNGHWPSDLRMVRPIFVSYTLSDEKTYTNNSQINEQDISYARTFNNTNWQTLYIPFSLSYDDWKDDFEIACINGVRQLDKDDNGTIDETIMDVIKIKSGSTTPNMPYLIKAKTTGEKTFSVSNATLYAAEENSLDCSTTIAKYTFTGTYSSIPSETMIANGYYAMGGGDLIQSDGSNDLKPYRWYMKVESRNPSYNVSNAAKTITINVVGDEEEETTTGVKELRITNDELPVYDINGRMVSDKNLKPGLYIKNGKKFVVK